MSKYKHQHDQLTDKHETVCEVSMDVDRIKITFSKIYPKPLHRLAEEMENMGLGMYTLIDGCTLFLMQPDYGLFANDDEFLVIVSDLCEEVNYNVIFK